MINANIERILFLDIETVPMVSDYSLLPERMKLLWNIKASKLSTNEEDTPETLFPRAGIYSEFGKIICISVGYVHQNKVRLKSFCNEDEITLLKDFIQLIEKFFSGKDHKLCAHNGKEFDFPYIARRILINGLKVPDILNTAGLKPWEVHHLDTMELWKFGDFKHYTSLDLLTAVFNIPSPKDDISGADVWKVYWQEKDLNRIKNYCQKDVLSIVQLMCRYLGLPLFEENQIILIE